MTRPSFELTPLPKPADSRFPTQAEGQRPSSGKASPASGGVSASHFLSPPGLPLVPALQGFAPGWTQEGLGLSGTQEPFLSPWPGPSATPKPAHL